MALDTDLALESYVSERAGKLEGVRTRERFDEAAEFTITEITVESAAAAKRLQKPCGTYITLETEAPLYEYHPNFSARCEALAREKFARLMHPEVWHECFTAPLTADLCLPQHAALYTDMCDRVYAHMGPALEKMTAQALRESGRDEKDAKRLTGVALYGILMMARRGEMTLEGAMNMIAQVLGLSASKA